MLDMATHQVLTLDDCLKVAQRYFDSKNVEVLKWQERKLSEKPAGYLGEHKIGEVYASCGSKEAVIPVFAKSIPTNQNQAALIATTGAFKKEITFYQEIVSAWEERGLIPNNSVPERKLEGEVTWNCRFYVARDDAVILENIGPLGYKSDSPRNTYDYEHAVMALKMLATFHAASLIYEEQMSSELGRPYRIGDELPDMVQDTFYLIKEGHPGEKTTETGIYAIVACARLLPIYQKPEVKKLVEEQLPEVLREVFESVKASKRFRNVLCHSDLWQNNILFRYSGEPTSTKKCAPIDVKLVDFQLLRYAPPAHDVWDFLYLTVRRSLRDTRGEELLKEYHTALAEAVHRRGGDIQQLLSWEEFERSLEDQRLSGRLGSVFALHFLMSSDEALGPVFSNEEQYQLVVSTGEARANLVCSQFQNDPIYRERLEECLMELLEFHVLT